MLENLFGTNISFTFQMLSLAWNNQGHPQIRKHIMLIDIEKYKGYQKFSIALSLHERLQF